MPTIALQPDVLRWARERAGLDVPALAKKVGTKPERVERWEQTGQLTFGQAEDVAHITHTPLGHLFLSDPLEDRLPIPDFRTVADRPLSQPSPDLLETVQTMQRRQNWMRDYLIEEGQSPLPFVGSASTGTKSEVVAVAMRNFLGVSSGWANECRTWTEALTLLRHRIDNSGILIVVNGVVGNNTHRKLDPDEFQGFALCDPYAPTIFINGADFKAPQMFTMAHELAHLWIGQDGVSRFTALEPSPGKVEQFCNAVAAEFLVPAKELRACWDEAVRQDDPFQFLARRFKVSAVVAARRTLDLRLIERAEFFDFYQIYREAARRENDTRKGGGDFWNNQNVRVGQRFGMAVVGAAREGRLLYREAFQLTGMSGATFDKFAKTLGFDAP